MSQMKRPDRTEAAEYYFTYIDKVPEGNILEILDGQLAECSRRLGGITEQESSFRYAAGKWSVKQVMSHVNDTERLFVFRAFWFARGFDEPLPSFDQDVAVTFAGADERLWSSHLREFETVRAVTMTFFRNLPDEAWIRRGIASGNPFTVRALAHIIAGHVTHHLKILDERYIPLLS